MREIKFRAWDSVLNEYRKLDMNSGKQNLGMGFEVMGGINSNITTILSLIHISEPTRHLRIAYAVFCLKKLG